MKRALALLLGLVMVLSLAACGDNSKSPNEGNQGSQSNGNQSGGQTEVKGEEGSIPGVKKDLIIGIAQDINQLNPQLQNDQINNNCITLTHQALVDMDNTTAEIIQIGRAHV